ncbi:MAG TPA: hypothetical protein EYP21_11185, partial [Syntrophaceae bacterium]|nr:hypothetical protein [Syntrophaceae bacterium]
MIPNPKSQIQNLCIIILLLVGALAWVLNGGQIAMAGPYLSSAHGNTSYGVDRNATGFPDYAVGNCAHCHEMHASIGGAEPAPTGGPDKYALFYNNYVSQTDGVCFKCHDATTTISATAIVNRSYSYRAGGWTDDTLDDILEAFTYGPPTSTTG